MTEQWDHIERRRYVRIEKHFIISYYVKSDPIRKYDISQLKNISMGGMCFVTSRAFGPHTTMGIELKTPYFAETAHIDGTTLASHEKVPNMIYETRLSFDALSPIAEVVLKKIVETFLKLSKEEAQNE